MNSDGVYVFSAPLMASNEPLGELPANSSVIPRLRGILHQASNVSHEVGDEMHAQVGDAMHGGTRPLTTLGASLSGALHSTLQRSMAEEGSDPFMMKLQHDRPDEWMKHEHDMQTADLAMQTLSALFGAIEQQGLR